MKTLLIVFLSTFIYQMAIAAPVEQKININIPNSYFSCDFLQMKAKRYLKEFGARDIKIKCTGGLPYFQHARIIAKYDAPSIEDFDADWFILDFKSRRDSNCQLDTTLMEGLMKGFEVASYKKAGSCFGSQGRYNVELVLLGWPK